MQNKTILIALLQEENFVVTCKLHCMTTILTYFAYFSFLEHVCIGKLPAECNTISYYFLTTKCDIALYQIL